MIYTSGKNINLKKYKRFFVFGCSFTKYLWPTWADILRQEMLANTQYYNYGQSGAGQLYILSTLSQALLHHNIGKDDLVAVMWSTFYREDRYLWKGDTASNNWLTPGNLYSQDVYDQNFLSQHCCTRGMYVRDLTLIHAGISLLANGDFDSFSMLSVPFRNQNMYAGIPDSKTLFPPTDDLENTYESLLDHMMPTLYSTEFNNGWQNGYYYKMKDTDQEKSGDYHPNVLRYLSYLEKLQFEISEQTKNWVGNQHVKISNIQYKSQFKTEDIRRLF